MKLSRHVTLAVATASCVLALAACKPIDKDAAAGADDKKAAEADKKDGALKIPGLATEKEQVGYLLGRDVGQNLKQLKDEIDLDAFNKGIRDTLADKKSPMTDEQVAQVMQAFAQKMQAKQQEEMAKKQAEMEAQGKKNIEEGAKFLAENGKKPDVKTTASGLQYQIITEGKGPKPKGEQSVKVHYTGTLLNGEKFDSSHDRNEPAQFMLNAVVPGWTEGLQLMPVGSKFKFWIPAKLGYGEQGTPGGPIPPNATLVFEVELLEIVKQ